MTTERPGRGGGGRRSSGPPGPPRPSTTLIARDSADSSSFSTNDYTERARWSGGSNSSSVSQGTAT